MKTRKQQHLIKTLQEFYQRPVARVSLELFFSVVAILFFAIFAIRPTLLTMSDLLNEIEGKEKLDGQLSQKIAALSSVQPLYLQLQNRLIILDDAIPSTPQLVYSLKIIEKIASELGLVINGISVSEIPDEITATNTGISIISLERTNVPISISVGGDYPTIRQFAENLKDYRRSFIIDTIVFSTTQLRKNKKLEARITLSMPYFGINNLGKKQ
ncbi:hypothetical protein KKE34_03160 [Patescibacteria group bacterium]|nr:hypothetical protein [Patescibacteria group bacterium]MBU1885585.1 hypothetical protein [Patescibacteria group bacterium]